MSNEDDRFEAPSSSVPLNGDELEEESIPSVSLHSKNEENDINDSKNEENDINDSKNEENDINDSKSEGSDINDSQSEGSDISDSDDTVISSRYGCTLTEEELNPQHLYKMPRPNKILSLYLPYNNIVIGELLFKIHFNCPRERLENKNKLSVYYFPVGVSSTYPLFEILTRDQGAHVTTGDLITRPGEDVCEKLMTSDYLWVLEDQWELSGHVVRLKVFVPADKVPISNSKDVAEFFAEKTFPTYAEITGKNVDSIETFFKEMQLSQKKNGFLYDVNLNVQHEKLKPTLCPYQAKAVRWMLKRESPNLESQNTDWKSSVLEILYNYNDYTTSYNIYTESIVVEHELPPLPRGGILADEMGLGKTVAVIALILNNPRSESNDDVSGEFFIPLTEEKVKKISAPTLTKEEVSSQGRERAKNMEGHLSPHEELVATRTKGTALKRALNKWYESMLSEYSTSSRSKIPRKSTSLIKCLCGDSSPKPNDDCVECNECKRLQHAECVGYQENYHYLCPMCWSNQKPIKSNATLIISPPNIYHQWYEEINKHVDDGAFRNGIFMYDGINKNFIQPSVLASYDIVICTYLRLRAELNRAVKNESSRKLRNEERFLKQCSPLAQVNWWRLCLDEAQMVEGDSSAISQMAKLLSAVNRWSVTGTPIQKSVNDMYHLIDFLRIKPYNDRYIWNTLLYKPYVHGNKTPLCSVMSQFFWRNSKEDVSDEIFIPEQIVKYHFLKFTAIEQNFYMREHTASSTEFNICLQKTKLDLNTKIDSLDKTTLTKILNPLLNLRQACSHFLAVKGNKISSKTGKMTMTDLFKYLHNKTKMECEEELRKYIAALNGMAGIYCIQEDWNRAVEYYRTALQICEEYKTKIFVDSLQRIHTLTNLAEILETHGEIEHIAPTLRDTSLKDEAKQLEDKYMGRVLEEFHSGNKLMTELTRKVQDIKSSFHSHYKVWWAHLLSILTVEESVNEVTDKVSAELLADPTENRRSIETFLTTISSPKSIELFLRDWLHCVKNKRETAIERVRALQEKSCDELVSDAVDCHLRVNNYFARKTKCEICLCENDLLDYECSLFAVTRKILKAEYEKVMDGAQTKGSWKPHKAERVLRVILNVSKNKCTNVEPWAISDGKIHMNYLEAMKKEFKQLRVMWMDVNHNVQARDELEMCKLRLRLRYPNEPLPPKPAKLNINEQNKLETIYIIEPHEIEAQRLKLTGEIQISKSEFSKKYGALVYLDNVGKKENPIPEPCPICKTALNNEWCVLQCGHCYCIECIRILLSRNTKPSINCPVCREITKSTELSFVDLSGREENSDITVVGEHSTKIEAVVRTLLALKQKEENVKVLIFSTWAVVLKVLAVALEQNGILFRRMPGYNYQVHLKEFRDPKMNITALLLPISWGSKGLNLIEATHVFLVEPIMNPAEELQALGRVHRVGQKNKTIVHRFLVKGTIEEKIFSTISEAKDKWDKKKVTLEDLKNLFDIKQGLSDSENESHSGNDN